jgi:CBS domain-containing protein
MKIATLLQQKGKHVYAVSPQASVFEALHLMAEKNIGAVLVMDGGELAGILSERDYARKIILKGKASQDTPVSEIMTSQVFTITPEHSLDMCMAIMSDKRIRHLPVVENDVVTGMVSISDVVTAIIRLQKDTIEQLHSYISQ